MRKEVLTVIEETCIGCMRCARACSFGAFEVHGNKPFINPELCVGCMNCVSACPVGAIKKA